MSFTSLVFIFMILFSPSIAEVVSMDSSPGFQDLRGCGNDCFGYQAIGSPLNVLASKLSCNSNNVIENSCFCRADLQDTGVRHLSTCVSNSCSGNMVDVAAATQFYKDYCTSAGYTAAPRSVQAQSTGGTTLAATTTKGGSGTPIETDKSSSSSEPSSSIWPGTNLRETIGIIAGIIGALAGVAGAFFGYKRYQQLKKARKQKQLEALDRSGVLSYRY